MFRILVLIASTTALATAVQAQGAAKAEPRTKAELSKALDARYAKVDANGDGALSADELARNEAQRIERAKAEVAEAVQRAFAKLDTDKDGKLSLEEYRAAAPTVTAKPAENAADIVKLLDKDKNGKVSSAEFKAPTLAAFDRIDANKDGTVSPEERRKAAANIGR